MDTLDPLYPEDSPEMFEPLYPDDKPETLDPLYCLVGDAFLLATSSNEVGAE